LITGQNPNSSAAAATELLELVDGRVSADR
jgi:hypothetical protein